MDNIWYFVIFMLCLGFYKNREYLKQYWETFKIQMEAAWYGDTRKKDKE